MSQELRDMIDAVEVELRKVYEKYPEYSDPVYGGGSFEAMVLEFATDDFYPLHKCAKALLAARSNITTDYVFITARVGEDKEEMFLVHPGTMISFNWANSKTVGFVNEYREAQLLPVASVTSIGITKKSSGCSK